VALSESLLLSTFSVDHFLNALTRSGYLPSGIVLRPPLAQVTGDALQSHYE